MKNNRESYVGNTEDSIASAEDFEKINYELLFRISGLFRHDICLMGLDGRYVVHDLVQGA
jgi:hypothetical protein